MTEIEIDKKKYVVLSRKDYDVLKKKAALKTKPEKTLTLSQSRAFAKQLIRKWSSEKSL